MIKQLLITFLSFSISLQVFAWGKTGHHIVAEIAFKKLDKRTRKNVRCYLQGMSIEDAATWMDDVRKDPSYDFMKPFHYINAVKGNDPERTTNENIVSVIEKTINELKNPQQLSKEEIKKRLCYLFHLVGDLHQPLHVGYETDKGGNTVAIYLHGKKENLHWLWDDLMIQDKKIGLKQCWHVKRTATQRKKLTEIDVLQWAKESRAYLPKVYALSLPNIDEQYEAEAAPIIKSQLNIAGWRLAAILKTCFGKNAALNKCAS